MQCHQIKSTAWYWQTSTHHLSYLLPSSFICACMTHRKFYICHIYITAKISSQEFTIGLNSKSHSSLLFRKVKNSIDHFGVCGRSLTGGRKLQFCNGSLWKLTYAMEYIFQQNGFWMPAGWGAIRSSSYITKWMNIKRAHLLGKKYLSNFFQCYESLAFSY